MSGSGELERFFARLAGEAGTPALDAAEAQQVLDLTRVVAHEVERRLAPLTAYALGLALDASMPPAERARQARALAAVVHRLAREGEAGATEGASEAGVGEAGATEAGATEAGATEAGATEAGASEAGVGEAETDPA